MASQHKRSKLKRPKHLQTERGMWNHFFGSGRRRATRRRVIRIKTEKMFTKGVSVKDILLRDVRKFFGNGNECVDNTRSEYLKDVHPRTWRYLELYGVDYKPCTWPNPPPMGEPIRKQCFLNAMTLTYRYNNIEPPVGRKPRTKAKRRGGRVKLHNVQGVAVGPLVWPMLHGWNAWGDRRTIAIDWTFYAVNKWTRYVGIPLTYEETVEISQVKDRKAHLISIFHKNSFNLKVRLKLTEIMLRRKRAGKKVPIRLPSTKKKLLPKRQPTKHPGKRRGFCLVSIRC